MKRLEDESLRIRVGQGEEVILHLDECLERIPTALETPRQSACGRDQEIALAVAEQLSMNVGAEEVAGVILMASDRVHLADPHFDALRQLPEEPKEIEIGELLLIARHQALGSLQEEHGVVTFECREDVGIGLEEHESILCAVPFTAAGLARLLDGTRGVGRGHRLQRSGLCFDFLRVGAVRRLAVPLCQIM